jgi:hypothetical protein
MSAQMAIDIICRKDALAIGRVRYFTGKPCKYGHVAERWCCDRQCADCKQKWRAENADKSIAQSRRWRAENIQRAREKNNKWYANNTDRARAYGKKWNAENPDKPRLYVNRRRALKLKAVGSHTAEQILDLFEKQKGMCINCRCSIKHGYQSDHIIALSKGGSNDIGNIQLLCRPCNGKKYNKDPILWAQQNGRLI